MPEDCTVLLDGDVHIVGQGTTSGTPLYVNVTNQPSDPATGTGQTTLATDLGATNELAASTDTATSGLNGLFKRMLQKFTADLGLASDAAATTDAGTFSLIALFKHYLTRGDKNIAFGQPAGMIISGSLGVPVINLWYVQKAYTVPAGKVLYPLGVTASAGVANYLTQVSRRVKLGSFNIGTNTYTDAGTSVPVGSSFQALYAEVTTILSAATAPVTLTYTDQNGTTGHSTNAATMGNTAVGQRNYFTLASGDIGAIDVTAASRTGVVTGIIDIYGETTLCYVRPGAANTSYDLHFPNPENFQVLAGEQITIEFQATATTATQRDVYVTYALKDINS